MEGLCSRDLLSRCVLGGSQNQNESFNGLIWRRCSKTDFSSPHTVQLAVHLPVYLAVLVFNEGRRRGQSQVHTVLGYWFMLIAFFYQRLTFFAKYRYFSIVQDVTTKLTD